MKFGRSGTFLVVAVTLTFVLHSIHADPGAFAFGCDRLLEKKKTNQTVETEDEWGRDGGVCAHREPQTGHSFSDDERARACVCVCLPTCFPLCARVGDGRMLLFLLKT